MTPDDIPAIATWMIGDSHWTSYGMTVDSISIDFAQAFAAEDLLLVATANERPLGFAWCVDRGMFGSAPYLKRIGVDPAITGRAIGTMLMIDLESRLAAAGAQHLYLLVGDQNPRAEAFYQRRGFAKIAEFPDLAVKGIAERLYRKELPALSY